jgi:hypothetical protein
LRPPIPATPANVFLPSSATPLIGDRIAVPTGGGAKTSNSGQLIGETWRVRRSPTDQPASALPLPALGRTSDMPGNDVDRPHTDGTRVSSHRQPRPGLRSQAQNTRYQIGNSRVQQSWCCSKKPASSGENQRMAVESDSVNVFHYEHLASLSKSGAAVYADNCEPRRCL